MKESRGFNVFILINPHQGLEKMLSSVIRSSMDVLMKYKTREEVISIEKWGINRLINESHIFFKYVTL